MKCEEIFAALALLEKERGIPQDFMLEKIRLLSPPISGIMRTWRTWWWTSTRRSMT